MLEIMEKIGRKGLTRKVREERKREKRRTVERKNAIAQTVIMYIQGGDARTVE